MERKFNLTKAYKNCLFLQKMGAENNRGILKSPLIVNALNYYMRKSGLLLDEVLKALNFEYILNNEEFEKIQYAFEEYQKQTSIKDLTCCEIAQFTKNKFCSECRLNGCLKNHAQFYSVEDKNNSQNDTILIPEFKIDDIPVKFLRELIANIQANINCSVEYVVISVLTVLGSTLGTNYTLALGDTWKIYSSLLSVLIGEPSSKKSPSMKAIVQVLQKVEEQTNINISVSNTTVEGVCKFLSENKKSVLIACDELRGWLNSLGEYKGKTSSDRQFYLTAWNVDKYVVLRKTTATLTIPKTHVSLLGSIQPQVLQDMFKYLQTGDGFIERLIWVLPPDYQEIGKYISRGKTKLDLQNYKVFENILKEILTSSKEKEYKLNSEGEKMLDEFNLELRQDLIKNKLFSALYGKAPELAGKLALIFQVFSDIETRNYDNNIIKENIFKSSLELTRYFIKQFIAVVSIFGNNNSVGANIVNVEDTVYTWLINRHEDIKTGFTPSYISTYKVAKIFKAEEAKNALENMLEKGRVVYNPISKKYLLLKE